MKEKIRQALCDMGYEDSILFSGPSFDDAIIGVSDEGRVIYDYNKMVLCLMRDDNITEDQAADFIACNTIPAMEYIDEPPIIMYPLLMDGEEDE